MSLVLLSSMRVWAQPAERGAETVQVASDPGAASKDGDAANGGTSHTREFLAADRASLNGSASASCVKGDLNEQACLARKGIELTQEQIANAWWQTAILALTLAAAFWTIRDGRRAINRQLRAYLFLEQFELLDGSTVEPPNPEFMNHPGINILIRNSGQTPASDVFHHARMEVRPVFEEALLTTPEPAAMSRTYVPSGGPLIKMLILGRNLAPQEIQGIAQGSHAIYLLGRIDYRDVFGKKRFTTYRLKYTGHPYPPNGGVSLVYCDQGNSYS